MQRKRRGGTCQHRCAQPCPSPGIAAGGDPWPQRVDPSVPGAGLVLSPCKATACAERGQRGPQQGAKEAAACPPHPTPRTPTASLTVEVETVPQPGQGAPLSQPKQAPACWEQSGPHPCPLPRHRAQRLQLQLPTSLGRQQPCSFVPVQVWDSRGSRAGTLCPLLPGGRRPGRMVPVLRRVTSMNTGTLSCRSPDPARQERSPGHA